MNPDDYAASAVIQDTVRINAYAVISDAVELGVDRGITRAHKHTNSPDINLLRECLYDAVMAELCETLKFS
jgi:acyl-[acyl carrier protein]--UDP-N-acetylglucosamine O-acyltransferase